MTKISLSAEKDSVTNGKTLYFTQGKDKQGIVVSCSTCHGEDPRQPGKTRANKIIEPMAASKNPNRFTDPAKTEKWFRRNCNDVFNRECTVREKLDFIEFMKSI